ncbi:MAG TPA: MBL fold metallo-hydrolase [Longimicrobium sp.]|nr:MBL fold metallo-hydrolase [Longimicrobium sp.]
MPRLFILPVFLTLLAAGCALPSGPRPVPALACGGACADSVGITYLGVDAFVIRHGNDVILTAGMLSAPSPTGLLRLRPDTARIDSILHAALPDPSLLRAVLVGHSHYDHAMDLPYLVRRFAGPSVKVWGNRALPLIFAADTAFVRRVAVIEEVAGDSARPGEWRPVPYRSFRFMALRSDHAPHLLRHFHLLPRAIDRPRTTLPRSARDYAEGQTLAYLIDFLDERGKVVFRIHFQDAAATPRRGFPPPLSPGDDAPVDVALLCGAAFAEVSGYPDGILRELRPRMAVVGHWEDFVFRPRADPAVPVPLTDQGLLRHRMDRALGGAARRWTPAPGETRWFCVCPRN